MKQRALLVFSLFLFITINAHSRISISEGVFLDANFRPRFEFDNRDFSKDTGYDAYGSFRARIGLMFENLIDDTDIYLMIGDSRMMGFADPYLIGTPPDPNGFDNNLGVRKAYIETRNLIIPGTTLKVGRMSNDQGRSYIFGPGNWNKFGPRTYDGIKIGYKNNETLYHLWSFFGANGDRHWYPAANDYKRDHTLTGMDVSFWTKTISFLIFHDLDQQPVLDTVNNTNDVALSRTTAAVNVKWQQNKKSGHRIDFDVAYQMGTKAYQAGNGDISAYMLAGDWSFHFSDRRKSWAGLGFHNVSDDASDPGKVGYFYDNYSSKHKTFGHMDYFKSPTSGMKPMGLQDIIIRGGLSPLKALSCKADLHLFSVKEKFASAIDGSSANTLGQELDLYFKYSIRKGLSSVLGIDLFFPTKDWKGSTSDQSTFIYVILTASL
ncbi:MAG: hypothetical protein P9X24_08625 [Candidatus Hatepunaea meridiana]|nr:hypothetical protein [Candidatus Hatepunaea meridiana]